MVDVCKDKYGNIYFDENSLFELIYSGNDISGLLAKKSKEIEQFNKIVNYFDEDSSLEIYKKPNKSLEEYNKELISEWFIPESYKNMDLKNFFLSKSSNNKEVKRIEYEYEKFKENELIELLRFLVYLVDVMRENNIVWGVGRGSSVASYILYILGIHKVNPIKYNISPDEFFK